MIASSKPRVIVAHLGARMHYAVPVLLHQAGFLTQFFTDAYAGSGSWINAFIHKLPSGWRAGRLQRLSQRIADLPAEKITAYNCLGFRFSYALSKRPSRSTYLTDVYLQYHQEFLRKVARSKWLKKANIAYSYTGAGLELIEITHKYGYINILEQMIAPVQVRAPLLEDELVRWKKWAPKGYINFDHQKWFYREEAEWNLADIILAPSPYVKTTLCSIGIPEQKVILLPYAVNIRTYNKRKHAFDGKRPLRIVFVGAVGIRKGVPYLLNALKSIGGEFVQAKLVGGVDFSIKHLQKYSDVATLVGHVSRNEVQDFYEWADIFVLPAISEGSATVIYEAMAHGLPIIATFESGAWIRDRIDGFIIPSRDSDVIANAIYKFLEDPSLVEQMSANTLQRISEFSWENYGHKLVKIINSLVLSS